jgi:hypothetical protein
VSSVLAVRATETWTFGSVTAGLVLLAVIVALIVVAIRRRL